LRCGLWFVLSWSVFSAVAQSPLQKTDLEVNQAVASERSLVKPLSLTAAKMRPWQLTPPAWNVVDKFSSSAIAATGADSRLEPSRDDDLHGSSYVPTDSWIYPALERLSAFGLISSQDISIRPWTRQECRRQVREARDHLYGFASMDEDVSNAVRAEAERLLPQLEDELKEPGGKSTAVLESAYVRYGSIMGPALTDGFHFGQTWWNDYGRPLGRGGSLIAGYSVRMQSGRYFLYARQEMQTDPGRPAINATMANLFQQLDNTYFGTSAPGYNLQAPAQAAYVRQRPLELYAGMAFAGYQLSFGKQAIAWGPTTMGSFSFSNNAEPTYNLRLLASRPHPFPFFPSLGSYRLDLSFGKLSGHKFPARPYFNAQKIDLTFGRYLEVGFARWSILWGVGHPMTLRSLKDNFFSSNSTGNNDYGARDDPGDRKSEFDFRLHVPGLSNSVMLYSEAYADDELNPIDAPRRVAWNPGIYVSRLPWLPHTDLRFEMASSEELSQDEGGIRFFINTQYRDGNTNKGFLLGNAVGRDARAFEGRLGYWYSSRTRIEAGYRQNKISPLFLPQGGTISDAFVNTSFAFKHDWTANLFTQYERYLVPSYLPGRQQNGSVRLQITWTPKSLKIAR
jgi:hypothetical protein